MGTSIEWVLNLHPHYHLVTNVYVSLSLHISFSGLHVYIVM